MTEHVQLRGHDGYYSRIVQVEGYVTRFRIRELSDEALQEAERLEREQSAVAKAVTKGDTPATALHEKSAQIVDTIVTAGLSGWDLPVPFDPELAKALPNPVKLDLAAEIMADTTFTPPEALFLSRRQALSREVNGQTSVPGT